MSTKTPECWESDPNAAGVKIILAPDDHLLLPFDQFIYADLKLYGEHQQLRLVFVTHEVSVRGDSLERIETIMQRKQLSLLKTLPNPAEGRQIGLLRRAQEASAATGCPIDFQQAAEFAVLPEGRADQGEEPGEAVTPLAQMGAEAQEHIGQQRRPDLPLNSVCGVAQKV